MWTFFRAIKFRLFLQTLVLLAGASISIGATTDVAAPRISYQTSPRSWSPRDFGAVPDGSTLNTQAFQAAIDSARRDGGGIVNVTAGRYVIGTIDLWSGVTLNLEEDVVLLGSPRLADYRRGNWPALIKARGQKQIAITGTGVIDGQGKLVASDSLRIFDSGNYLEFYPGLAPDEKIATTTGGGVAYEIDPHALQRTGDLRQHVAPRSRDEMATWRVDEAVRPQILEFWECQDVRVSGITLKHAANWVQTYRECDDVLIDGIQVDSTTYWNNDGIDVVNCHRVRINNCDINSADDGVCLKSDPSSTGRGCEDITVTNCRLRTSASGFKLGTASHQGFRRIRAFDLEVRDTFRSAVALESVDGAVIDDVVISRVKARNTGCAFFLRLGQRNTQKPPGLLRNVLLSDFDVQVPFEKPDRGYEHEGPPAKLTSNLLPSSIVGLPDQPIENVTLRNISISHGGGGKRKTAEVPLGALASIPQQRESYPEFSMFGELPAWGLFLRHARGIRLENVALKLGQSDFRSALVADDIDGLTLDGVKFHSRGDEPVLVLSRVRHESLLGIEWPSDSGFENIRRLP